MVGGPFATLLSTAVILKAIDLSKMTDISEGSKIHLRAFWNRYGREIALSLIVSILFLIITAAGSILFNKKFDPIWFLIAINFAFFCILVYLQGIIRAEFARLRDIVIFEIGVPWRETQYHRREKHFVEEKAKLASIFVEETLPALCDEIQEKYENPKIRVILDSGTTITPVFEQLVRKGIASEITIEPEIYTNNLAGIIEIEKLDHLLDNKLKEEDFMLIGGNPLSRYRATTGAITEETLKNLFTENKLDGQQIVTVGVLTANWLLSGPGQSKISLCARGRGHPQFKDEIVKSATYLVIISPLGKILQLGDVERLNELLPEEETLLRGPGKEYSAIEIPATKKETAFLLTTSRPDPSDSPLVFSSKSLHGKSDSYRGNFRLRSECPEYSPPGGKNEVLQTDLPHSWTRKSDIELFGAPENR